MKVSKYVIEKKCIIQFFRKLSGIFDKLKSVEIGNKNWPS